MMDKVFVTQNDRAPKLRKTLVDANGPLDLSTGVTNVTFSMRIIDSPFTVKVTNQVSTIVDAPNGVVEYPWAVNDLDTPGIYLGEFTVNYAGSLPATFPSPNADGPNKIYITVGAQIA